MAAKTYTISENLELLAQNKQAIKNAIIAKGGTITDSTPLSQYATQIENLPSGGGSSTDYYVSGTSSANTFTVKVNNTKVTPTFTASGSGYTWKVDLNSYEVANLNQFAFPPIEAITSVDMSHAGNAVGLTYAFYNCKNLTEYTPNPLDACIYERQFGNTGLRAYTIPSYCAVIGDEAFWACTAMTSVNIPEKAVMGKGCFSQAGLTEVSMYNRYYIPVGTFQNCNRLFGINSDVVNSVGDRAFLHCGGFQAGADFFELLETIGESAFQGCGMLSELSFMNCQSIGANAFSGCTGLNGIWFGDEYVRGHTEIPTLGKGAFDDTNGCTIFVPAGMLSDFLAVYGWAAYEDRLQEAGDGIKLLDGNGNEVYAGYTNISIDDLDFPDKLYVGGDDSWYHLKLVSDDEMDMFFDGSIEDFNESDTFEKTNIENNLKDRNLYIIIDDALQRKIKFIEY